MYEILKKYLKHFIKNMSSFSKVRSMCRCDLRNPAMDQMSKIVQEWKFPLLVHTSAIIDPAFPR